MKTAILSDVHANLQALQAVLDDVDRAGAEEIWLLGDLVVYGANPRECIRVIKERMTAGAGSARVTHLFCGNNDFAIINDRIPDNESLFEKTSSQAASAGIDGAAKTPLAETVLIERGDAAKASHIWTSRVLSNDDKNFLRGFTQIPVVSQNGKWVMLHANPCDPMGLHGSYVRAIEDAEEAFVCMEAESHPHICFLGHTHMQSAFCQYDPSRLYANVKEYNWQSLTGVTLKLSEPTAFSDGRSPRWLINPGSVGQPRDGNPNAGYALFDSEALTMEFRRLQYDVNGAVEALKDIDLSITGVDKEEDIQKRREMLIERLETGGLK